MRVDYYGIETAIKDILEADAGNDLPDNLKVFIESQIAFNDEGCPGVYIYLDRRDAPPQIQRIAAGTRTDMEVDLSLWCAEFHDSVEDASRLRDDLIGKVEVALMADRTLNDTVTAFWLRGGDFNMLQDNGFLSMGEIKMRARVVATT